MKEGVESIYEYTRTDWSTAIVVISYSLTGSRNAHCSIDGTFQGAEGSRDI